MTCKAVARALLRQIPKSILYEIFYQSGRALGVRSYEVAGSLGNFSGPLYDQSVIRPYLFTGEWSNSIVSLFLEYFGNGFGTMYDVGANIGLISVPVSRLPNVTVLAFEPDPRNASLLRANLALAGTQAEVIIAAVADTAGTLRFTHSEYNSGDHRLSVAGDIEVSVTYLDQFPPKSGKVAVKIDTQGAEPLIFKGGKNVLAHAGLIVSEFWPWGMARMGQKPDEILAFTESNFDRGMTLRHGQLVGDPLPIGHVISNLQQVIAAGGENDAVDLVLVR